MRGILLQQVERPERGSVGSVDGAGRDDLAGRKTGDRRSGRDTEVTMLSQAGSWLLARSVVMRSADAVVTACLVDSIDEITYWHGANNGKVCRAFAGADRREVGHE